MPVSQQHMSWGHGRGWDSEYPEETPEAWWVLPVLLAHLCFSRWYLVWPSWSFQQGCLECLSFQHLLFYFIVSFIKVVAVNCPESATAFKSFKGLRCSHKESTTLPIMHYATQPLAGTTIHSHSHSHSQNHSQTYFTVLILICGSFNLETF